MKRILEENLAGSFQVQLAREPWQGLDLPLTLDVCPSPTCDCRQVHVSCPDPEDENASLRFTVSLDDNALAEVSDHGRLPVFEALVDAMQEADWVRLQAANYQAKELGMEAADLSHLAVTFPPDALRGSCFVGYHELIPSAMPLPFVTEELTGQILDQYKVGNGDESPEALLQVEFYRGEPGFQVPDVALGTYDYARNQVLVAHGLPKATFRLALDKLRHRIPELDQVFALRHQRVKALFALAKARHTPVRAMHTGRNEPCPCGSGRKYKRCCGLT
jgi:hypothetical protein